MFDYAAKYKNEFLIGSFLPGTDLTNLLVLVLLIFRQVCFAFIADDKSTFYHVGCLRDG